MPNYLSLSHKTAQLNLLKLTQRSESLVILSGSSTTGLNGKPFIPWSKTSGITFLIILNAPFISAFNNLLSPVLYNPLAILFPGHIGFESPYFGMVIHLDLKNLIVMHADSSVIITFIPLN
ncbi:MAG: hypothetical protein WBA93_07525 [Microcoleaceae cyanobacterium]